MLPPARNYFTTSGCPFSFFCDLSRFSVFPSLDCSVFVCRSIIWPHKGCMISHRTTLISCLGSTQEAVQFAYLYQIFSTGVSHLVLYHLILLCPAIPWTHLQYVLLFNFVKLMYIIKNFENCSPKK